MESPGQKWINRRALNSLNNTKNREEMKKMDVLILLAYSIEAIPPFLWLCGDVLNAS